MLQDPLMLYWWYGSFSTDCTWLTWRLLPFRTGRRTSRPWGSGSPLTAGIWSSQMASPRPKLQSINRGDELQLSSPKCQSPPRNNLLAANRWDLLVFTGLDIVDVLRDKKQTCKFAVVSIQFNFDIHKELNSHLSKTLTDCTDPADVFISLYQVWFHPLKLLSFAISDWHFHSKVNNKFSFDLHTLTLCFETLNF